MRRPKAAASAQAVGLHGAVRVSGLLRSRLRGPEARRERRWRRRVPGALAEVQSPRGASQGRSQRPASTRSGPDVAVAPLDGGRIQRGHARRVVGRAVERESPGVAGSAPVQDQDLLGLRSSASTGLGHERRRLGRLRADVDLDLFRIRRTWSTRHPHSVRAGRRHQDPGRRRRPGPERGRQVGGARRSVGRRPRVSARRRSARGPRPCSCFSASRHAADDQHDHGDQPGYRQQPRRSRAPHRADGGRQQRGRSGPGRASRSCVRVRVRVRVRRGRVGRAGARLRSASRTGSSARAGSARQTAPVRSPSPSTPAASRLGLPSSRQAAVTP